MENPATQSGGQIPAVVSSGGSAPMTLRDTMAVAMLQYALNDGAGSVETAAKELGIQTKEYRCEIHWPILAAKHAYEYADAMLRARVGDFSPNNPVTHGRAQP